MRTRLRGGTYNCLYGRKPGRVKRFIRSKLLKYDLDFLLLQEVRDYLEVLNRIPGYTLIVFTKKRGQDDEAILVKNTVVQGAAWSKQMTETHYYRVTGRKAPLSYMPTVILDDWLRVASVHLPVSVDWVDGVAQGPERRVIAYSEYAGSLLEFDRHRRKHEPHAAVLIGGDWNEPPKSEGVFSPKWIADECGMTIQRTVNKDRSKGYRKIDYAMVRGAAVEATEAAEPASVRLRRILHLSGGRSDHPLIVFTVVRDQAPPAPPVCPTCGQLLPA